jgi:hypothetical protein
VVPFEYVNEMVRLQVMYKLIIVLFSCLYLCTICINTHSEFAKLVRYNSRFRTVTMFVIISIQNVLIKTFIVLYSYKISLA